MSNNKKILLIALLCGAFLVAGCSRSEEDVYKDIVAYYDLTTKYQFSVTKCGNETYLIGYKEEYSPFINAWYFIYNDKTKESVDIQWARADYIKEVVYEEGNLYFDTDGTNVAYTFRELPHRYQIDLESGDVKLMLQPVIIDQWQRPVYLGGGMNEVKLRDLSCEPESITFFFSESEDTVLAGGGFCPQFWVTIPAKNVLLLDFDHLIDPDKILDKSYDGYCIDEMTYRTYYDLNEEVHTEIKLVVNKDFNAYNCEFIEDINNFVALKIDFY